MEEQIDILMATYNSNIEYLKKQIESILNQTYKNIKLIISDDNSTNKEVQEELKKYQIKDKKRKCWPYICQFKSNKWKRWKDSRKLF